MLCYLVDLPSDTIESPYTFQRDYVVIDESFVRAYISTYKAGSAIWGGFIHLEDDAYVASKFTRADKRLVAHPMVVMPTVAHKEALARGLRSISHKVRFLHYYHQMELLFDMILVKELQKLGSDLNGIGA